MESHSGDIRNYYDQNAQYEWDRKKRHRTEFALTKRALIDYLPEPPADILDCGGGPGRYTIELSRLGYQVTLFDLSEGNLKLAQVKASEAGIVIAGCEKGNATDLSRFESETFDAVLLMGPMYHLIREDQRGVALDEVHRVLKPGGKLFVAFLTSYTPIRYSAVFLADQILENLGRIELILEEGFVPPPEKTSSEFIAHFVHPTEVTKMIWDKGFEVVNLLGLEGLVSRIEEEVNKLNGEAWQAWVDLNYRVAADESIHGCTEHLMVVAEKPNWRYVLPKISKKMNKVNLNYTIVGGASLALHGLKIPVKDIDIETDKDGAYYFEELFSKYVIRKVSLKSSDVYRSHFGEFSIDGTKVEVIGDLHRLEGGTWQPTWSQTRDTILLDDIPVNISWLEEETLAYLRRGKIDRVCMALNHCDHAILLNLLRRKTATNVL